MGLQMSRELIEKYGKKDVRIDKQTILADENYFPSVSICLKPPRKKAYCGIDILEQQLIEGASKHESPALNTSCSDFNTSCPNLDTLCAEDYVITTMDKTFEPVFSGASMSIGHFNVQCQGRGICNLKLFDKKYFKVWILNFFVIIEIIVVIHLFI